MMLRHIAIGLGMITLGFFTTLFSCFVAEDLGVYVRQHGFPLRWLESVSSRSFFQGQPVGTRRFSVIFDALLLDTAFWTLTFGAIYYIWQVSQQRTFTRRTKTS